MKLDFDERAMTLYELLHAIWAALRKEWVKETRSVTEKKSPAKKRLFTIEEEAISRKTETREEAIQGTPQAKDSKKDSPRDSYTDP